jgi:hypothetical protein
MLEMGGAYPEDDFTYLGSGSKAIYFIGELGAQFYITFGTSQPATPTEWNAMTILDTIDAGDGVTGYAIGACPPNYYIKVLQRWSPNKTTSEALTVGQYTKILAATVGTPVVSIAAGVKTNSIACIITCPTAGATIRYTTDNTTPVNDGSDPAIANGGTLTLNGNTAGGGGTTCPLKVKAFKTAYNDSAVTSKVYTFTCVAPTITPNGGTYPSPKVVTFATTTNGATGFRYTTDDTTPTGSSPFANPNISLTLPEPNRVRVLAQKTNYNNSAVTVSNAWAQSVASTPTFNPTAGAYADGDYPNKSVTIDSNAPNIRYTTDGSAPTSSHGTLIGSPGTAVVDENDVLKAIAYGGGYDDSAVKSGTFTATHITATSHSPTSGSYGANDTASVTVSTPTPGCQIRWTVDGTTPTSSHGSLIAGSSGTAMFSGNGWTTQLKSIAFKSGYDTTSVTTTGNYVFALDTGEGGGGGGHGGGGGGPIE